MKPIFSANVFHFSLGALLFVQSLAASERNGAASAGVRSIAVDRSDLLERRWRRAYQSRAYPLPSIPPQARELALDQIARARSRGQLAAPGALGFQWYNFGPRPILTGPSKIAMSGRVTSLAVDPGNPAHWLIGAAQGGVWETANAGASFHPITDDQATLATGAIAFAPSDPLTVYVGTGEANFSADSYAGAGLLRSQNGGVTWSLLAGNTFAASSFSDLRVNPTSPSTLVAATTRGVLGVVSAGTNIPPHAPPRGVFRSTDGGGSWTRTLTGEASDLEVDGGNFNRQFAALGEIFGHPANGLYRSLDAGLTWVVIAGPWQAEAQSTNVGRVELALSPSDPNTLYVSMARRRGGVGSLLIGLWKTSNARAATPTWSSVTPPPVSAAIWYYHELSVHPTSPSTLFFGEEQLWRLNGNAWNNLTGSLHVDQHALAWTQLSGQDPRLIVGNDGGVWSGPPDGSAWANHNEDLSIAQFHEGSVHPQGDPLALGGSQDNGTEAWAGKSAWRQVYGGDGADNAISDSNPGKHWAVSWQFANILRTKDGGANFNSTTSGLGLGTAPFITRFEKSPHDDNLFIAGLTRMWKCVNFFSATTPQWQSNGPELFRPDNTPAEISALAFAPSDTTKQTYAYGTEVGQLRITANGGTEWLDLDPADGVPGRYVTDLAFHPTDPNSLYVTLSGFDAGTPGAPGHLFRTGNALSGNPVWINVSPPVDLPHLSIVLHPKQPNLLYVGTDLGIWDSFNAGTTWSFHGTGSGMPNVAVFELQSDRDGRLFAFTHGRGAFEYRFRKPKIFYEVACPLPCQLGWVNPLDLVTLPIHLFNVLPIEAEGVIATIIPSAQVQSFSGPQSYGTLVPGGPAVVRTFRVILDAAPGANRAMDATCGQVVLVTVALTAAGEDLGTITVPIALGEPVWPLRQDFEQVAVPNLPDGWRTSAEGEATGWLSATNRPANQPGRFPPDKVSDPLILELSPNMAAFAPVTRGRGESSLDSPRIPIATAGARLSFRHSYELNPSQSGGVLEISMAGEPFIDIIRAGGEFEDNGYSDRLIADNPLGSRDAWSGDSGGWIVTTVRLPAELRERDVRFRWRQGVIAAETKGGWYIDQIEVLERICREPLGAPLILRPRRLADGRFAFSFATVPGRRYVAEYKMALGESSWRMLQEVLGDGTEVTVTDPQIPGDSRYYRLKVE